MQFASRPHVFLSYSRKDGEVFARQLRIELESAGVTVWQDRTQMEGGVDWWSQITQALQTVQFMVLVATPGALGSEVVRKEWSYARRQGVWVYPVVVPGNPPDFNVLPRWMKNLHFYDYSHAESRESFFKHIQQVEHKRPRVPYAIEKEPDGFVDRPQELEAILNQLLDKDRQNPVAITAALKGAGGYGKTTLAHAVCRHPAIQQAFDDGILWVTLGENPGDLIAVLVDWIERLSNERPGFATIEAARNRLKEIIEDRDILLVVDDLWKPEHLLPFTDLGDHCALLVTTRYELTLPVGAHRIHVDAMGDEQALALLSSGISVLPDHVRLMHMVKRLGHWPLLLTLANGVLRRRVQNQSAEAALTYVEKALDKLGLDAFDERNSDDRNRAVAKTLQVTFDLLKEREYRRFRELAIFPEDVDIPLSVVGQLWHATGGLDDVETEMLCELLHNLSLLLKFDPGQQVIRLHDVIRTYLVTLEPDLTSSEQCQLTQWHALFLDAYGVTDWVRLPVEDDYAWRYLSYHLFQAKRRAELRSLLTNLHWLQMKGKTVCGF